MLRVDYGFDTSWLKPNSSLIHQATAWLSQLGLQPSIRAPILTYTLKPSLNHVPLHAGRRTPQLSAGLRERFIPVPLLISGLCSLLRNPKTPEPLNPNPRHGITK